jgi:hypothetical protein
MVTVSETNPYVLLFDVRSVRATMLGRYPSSAAAAIMRARTVAEILLFGLSLRTWETAPIETPASLATRAKVTRDDLGWAGITSHRRHRLGCSPVPAAFFQWGPRFRRAARTAARVVVAPRSSRRHPSR